MPSPSTHPANGDSTNITPARLRSEIGALAAAMTPAEQQVCKACVQALSDDPIDTYKLRFSAKSVQSLHQLIDIDGNCAPQDRVAHVLLSIMTDTVERGLIKRFPESSALRYRYSFDRIASSISERKHAYLAEINDRLFKELGIVRTSIIPGGARIIVPDEGIARRALHTGGLCQSLRFLRVLARTGARHFYILHVHSPEIGFVSPEGWYAVFHQIADLMRDNPVMRGVSASGWLHDPKLADVSPHLAYHEAFFTKHGAGVFFVGFEGEESYAFSKSRSRFEAFREGRYRPALYTGIILRDQLLDWDARHHSGPHSP